LTKIINREELSSNAFDLISLLAFDGITGYAAGVKYLKSKANVKLQ
jgi:hypothetical protein